MTGLHVLYLPILLSAVLVFFMSSIIHMVLPWHKGDYGKFPSEDKAMDALRALNIPPGDYMVPRPSSMADLKTDEFKEKLKIGPVLVVTVMPSGGMQMGRALGGWFVYSLIVSLFAGYVAGRALPPGSDYLHVFRFIGVTAFLGYSGALWQMAIWYHRSVSTTFKSTVDGLIYALLSAGVFGWLWPR